MKIRRKLSTCQNCGCLLDRNFNFCPECGQENDDKNVSFGIVFREFMDTFFALDGSFFRTLKPFVSNPGYLTIQYNSGKRKSYANPIRLYLIISVFYFFTIGIMGTYITQPEGVTDSELVASDSLASYFSHILASDTISTDDKEDILENLYEELPAKEQGELIQMLDAEQAGKMIEMGITNYSTYGQGYYGSNNSDIDTAYYNRKARDTSAFISNRINNPLIREMNFRGNYTDHQILDSMHLGKLKWWEEYLAIQTIRTERSGGQVMTEYIIQNMPIMMLIVIPLFAMILKLFYIRRKQLYVQHLIHALHLHSFAYLIYGIVNLLLIYLLGNEDFGAMFAFFTFVGVSTYAYISFLKVYRQGWIKTLIKFNLVGHFYLFMIIFFFAIEAFVSFLLY